MQMKQAGAICLPAISLQQLCSSQPTLLAAAATAAAASRVGLQQQQLLLQQQAMVFLAEAVVLQLASDGCFWFHGAWSDCTLLMQHAHAG